MPKSKAKRPAERLGNLSCVRAVATALIVACHIFQGLDLEIAFWLNIGVQIFFILSGYLYGKKEIKCPGEFYKKQFLKIMMPYWIVCVVMLAIEAVRTGLGHYNIFNLLGTLLGFGYWTGAINGLSHTWFISYILLCYLITPLLRHLVNKKSVARNFITLALLTIILQLFASFGVLNIDVSYVMLYIFGFVFSNIEGGLSYAKTLAAFTGLAAVVLAPRIMVQYFAQPTLTGWLDYFHISVGQFVHYSHALIGIALFLALKQLFAKVKCNKFLALSDRYSYLIYLVHQIFILNMYSLLFVTDYLALNILLILVAVAVAAWALGFAMRVPSLISRRKATE